jgi:hypothetical protein
MSSASDILHTLPPVPSQTLRRAQLRSLVIGAAALVPAIIGAFFWPGAFFPAYLVAFLFYLGIANGSFVIVMIYYLTGGAWGFLMRRPLEAAMRTIPLMALLFVPIACGIGYLFPWAQAHDEPLSAEWDERLIYLNPTFFWIRAAIIFAVWLLVALGLTFWSSRQDRTGDPTLQRKLNVLAGPGLALFGIVTMFAAVDWVQSLQPAFHSSIIGPLLASGQFLTGHAVAILIVAWLVRRPPVRQVVSDAAIADIGNLLFTWLIVWAYMEYFQYMLIWIANLPTDVIWYLPRSDGPWYWVVWLIFILHFAVPFILLLFRTVAHNPRALTWVASLILVMHGVYLYTIVLPIFDISLWQQLFAPLTMVGMGGLWLACYLWTLERWPLLALHDPNQAAAIHFHLHDIEEQLAEDLDREMPHA